MFILCDICKPPYMANYIFIDDDDDGCKYSSLWWNAYKNKQLLKMNAKMAIPPQWHTHTLSAACVQQFIYELITKWAVCKLSCILKFVMLNFTHDWKPVSFLMQQKHEAFDACHFIGRSSLKCRLRLTHWIMSDHLNEICLWTEHLNDTSIQLSIEQIEAKLKRLNFYFNRRLNFSWIWGMQCGVFIDLEKNSDEKKTIDQINNISQVYNTSSNLFTGLSLLIAPLSL